MIECEDFGCFSGDARLGSSQHFTMCSEIHLPCRIFHIIRGTQGVLLVVVGHPTLNPGFENPIFKLKCYSISSED